MKHPGRFTAILAAAAVAGAGLFASAADASVILHDFEDANNGWKHYTSQGYTYNPINLNSSTRCFNDVPLPRHCFLEVKQGDPTMLYHSGAADGGSSDPADAPASTNSLFDLLSFFFNFQGQGGSDPQWLDVFGEKAGNPTTRITLDDSYDGTGDFAIYNLDGSLHTGQVVKQVGYFVIFKDLLFDDITKFTFDASDTAQVRIDCVALSPDGMNMSPANLSDCGPTVIPVAPALPLMASAIGILAVLTRRSWFKA